MTKEMNANTTLYGLIGNPVRHSLSPIIQNYLFNKYSLNGAYLTFEVKENKLEQAIEGIRALGISGANITAPYKEKVMEYIDVVCESAQNADAVNTIKNADGILYGFNTDYEGVIKALEYEKVVLKGKKAVILGSGGVVGATGLALGQVGIGEIVILNRTVKRAEIISKKLEKRRILCKHSELNIVNIDKEISDASIIINTLNADIFKEDSYKLNFEKINGDAVFFDVTYNPRQTTILKMAENYGFKTINGIGMLIFQGIGAFEIWTGICPGYTEIKEIFSKLI